MMRPVRTLSVVFLLLASAGTAFAQDPAPTVLVPTHPRLAFRKDDLPRLRRRCLTTHAAEYAVLKSSADRAAALETQPFAAGFLWQLTGESRYLAWANSDYDAFHEVLDAATAQRLANDVLYTHRRRMSAVDGRPAIGDVRYMTVFGNRDDVLAICGDDVALARPGELTSRLRVLAQAFREARETYAAIGYRRGGKNTSFHCACFFNDVPRFYERWRVATGENHFVDTLMTGLILQGAHSTLPLEHHMAPMTNSWGHDHLGRPAEYLIASRARDGLCQWVIHNPAWVTARPVGTHDPRDFNALGHAWVEAVRGLGGYKESIWGVPVGWWHGHMLDRILWYDPDVKEVPPQSLPAAALFEGLGMACMRSAWTDDAVFARLHSGPNFRGEPPHLNDNTFILYHKGWLVKPERSTDVLTSHASSVLVKDPDETIVVPGSCGGLWPDALWDGEGRDLKPSKENDGGQSWWRSYVGHLNTKARGHVAAWEDTGLYTYAVGDATMSYNPAKLRRFTRQFLYLRPGLFLVFDRVVSTKPEFEKRWVLHTKGEPQALEDGRTFYADALNTVKPGAVRGWERTVGFEDPVTEKAATAKTTLRFETLWDGVELGVVHDAEPDFGKVSWTLDGGPRRGEIDRHADEEKKRVETVLLRELPKGKHTLELTWPDEKAEYAFFTVRFGGRLFVTTLLPDKMKREVTPDKNAEQDPFSIRADWRTDVVPETPQTDDVFLHVLEATDRRQEKPTVVETTDGKDEVVLKFTYGPNRYEVTFNRTGITGGRVRVTAEDGRELADRKLAPGIVDADDPHILRCRREIAEHPLYDYEVSDIAALTPTADTAELVKALADARWHVRFYAVRGLGAKRDRAAAALLMTRLKDDDLRVAAAAAETLGQLGAAEAQPVLMNLLESPEPELRRAAACSLGRLETKPASPALVRLLDDPNDFVSVAAADALAQIGHTAAVEPIARQLVRRDAPHLKTSYLWAIATLGGDAARAHLEAFRKSEDGTLRACAVGALVRLDGKKSVAMLKTLRTDASKDVRTFAARKLAEFGDASFLGEMVTTAKDTEAAFGERTAALDMLGRTGNRRVADDVAPLLADETKHDYPFNRDAISVHAALALYRVGDPRGLKYLGDAVLRGDQKDAYHVARSAATALGQVRREEAVPLLAKALEVRRSQTIGFVVESLWKVTGEDPGADIEMVGWRRPLLDAERWREWWTRNEAAYR